jgi:hypothetical protein
MRIGSNVGVGWPVFVWYPGHVMNDAGCRHYHEGQSVYLAVDRVTNVVCSRPRHERRGGRLQQHCFCGEDFTCGPVEGTYGFPCQIDIICLGYCGYATSNFSLSGKVCLNGLIPCATCERRELQSPMGPPNHPVAECLSQYGYTGNLFNGMCHPKDILAKATSAGQVTDGVDTAHGWLWDPSGILVIKIVGLRHVRLH